ncbi:MAG: beta galactosidase jelly roll domain-containing protein [Algisphaera sp.]
MSESNLSPSNRLLQKRRPLFFFLSLILCFALPCSALELPDIFSDHMVLQRNKPIPVWGWAQPGSTITVSFAQQQTATQANAENGQWALELPALPASAQGRELTITQSDPTSQDSDPDNNPVVFKDVLVGEVWFCGGQSNMAYVLKRDQNAQQAIADSNVPTLRLFPTPRATHSSPQDQLRPPHDVSWVASTPKTSRYFSAVGYYFGRQLHDTLNVPVGLIASHWGGTRIEAWTSQPTLAATPVAAPLLLQHSKETIAGWDQSQANWERYMKLPRFHQDPGDIGDIDLLKQGPPAEQKASSTQLKLPDDVDGVVWYGTTFDLPDKWTLEEDLALNLGVVDDFDTTYVNGIEVGRTGEETPEWWKFERQYVVPHAILKPSKNTIAVRVFDRLSGGGMLGESIHLARPSQNNDERPAATLPLTQWTLYGENLLRADAIRGPNTPPPHNPGQQHQPAVLYNAMVHPIAPYAMRGVIWYQGESNASRAEQYQILQPTLIQDWRHAWAASPWDVPHAAPQNNGSDNGNANENNSDSDPLWFFITQIASFTEYQDQPNFPKWNLAELRDAQFNTARNLSRTGIAITLDIGDAKDIHPANKADVGDRLARWALVDTYDQKDTVKSGPLFRDALFADGQAVVQFDLFDSTLKLQETPESDATTLGGFILAGKDQVFHNAQAQIDGDVVRVQCPQVPHPVAVRYAWQNNPANANLFNAQGLPAGPFRSDTWPGVTAGVLAP